MNSTAFRDVTPCNSKISRSFGKIYRLYLQGRRASHASYQQKRWNAELGLLFNSIDGGDMFLRNVWLTPLHTRRSTPYVKFHHYKGKISVACRVHNAEKHAANEKGLA
jgi:hypothetical protein